MEDMLMRSSWLVAIAIVALLAVGCGSPSPQVVSTADAPTPVVAQSPEDRQAATPPPVAPAREAAALLAIDPQPAPQSGQVHISGKGFAAGESVSISVAKTADAGSQTLPLARAVTSSDGAFNSVTLTLPDELQSGPRPVNAAGQTSARDSTATLWIRAPQPWLELTSWSGAPGAPVGFGGGGWIASERVTIHIGSATSPVESTGAADDGGWLKGIGQVYVSNDAGDDVIFVAVGEQSHLVAAATFKVVFPFGLRPSQSQSPPVPQVKNGG